MEPRRQQALASHIATANPGLGVQFSIALNELTLSVRQSDCLLLMSFLRDDCACRFTTFVDLTALECEHSSTDFRLVYHLLSMPLNQRVRVRTDVSPDQPAASVIGVYPAAIHFEQDILRQYGRRFPAQRTWADPRMACAGQNSTIRVPTAIAKLGTAKHFRNQN